MDAVYLDHAAHTALLPEAAEAMREPLALWGNPASSHRHGRRARQLLEDARERVAAALDAEPGEIVFVSGTTEANHLALRGLVRDPHAAVLTSDLEHLSVLGPLAGRPRVDFTIGPDGVVDLSAPLASDVGLVALQLVNHETGAIQPVAEVASRTPAPLHCDAAAAVGKIPVSFRRLGAATLALGGHKFRGPPGVGVLALRKGVRFDPTFVGGHQQQGRRPGTEPVALAVGLAVALDWATARLAEHARHAESLRARFVARLAEAAPFAVNSPERGAAAIVNVSFPGCAGDGLLMALDLAGVSCSTGSACSSGSLQPSPVLRAMGLPPALLRSALRFSFGPETTLAEIDWAADRIVDRVRRLRSLAE